MAVAIIKHYFLGKSWDSIAEKSGYKFHIDYLHLNNAGADLIVDLISENLTNNV